MEKTYRTEKKLTEDGKLILDQLPFHAGDWLEITIRAEAQPAPSKQSYPMRGKVIKYDRPFDPVAEDDWEALK